MYRIVAVSRDNQEYKGILLRKEKFLTFKPYQYNWLNP